MFAYLDEGGIIHVAKEEETAQEYAKFNGKIIKTELGDGYGMLMENDVRLYIYAKEGKFYEGGNAKNGKLIDVDTLKKRYPGSYDLYRRLRPKDSGNDA